MSSKPMVLFRRSLVDEDELGIASRYFDVIERRTQIERGRLVIPRYSALPFNRELEQDVEALGGTLINSHAEHSRLADIAAWYPSLAGFTPPTWLKLEDVRDYSGPVVLKGRTNSKKHLWSTCMFAREWGEVVAVHAQLMNDCYIGDQDICVREYVPLRKLCDPVSPSGPPVSEEYRFFVLDGGVLASGFYWSTYADDIDVPVSPDFVPEEFLFEVIARVRDLARFIVIDIARTEKDDWIVIELNDGQQSGLCGVAPDDLYQNLARALFEK